MQNNKSLTVQQKEKLVSEIIEYLMEYSMFNDVILYANGNAYSAIKTDEPHLCKYGMYYCKPNVDVQSMLEYSNPDTVTMSFESTFYDAINGFDEWSEMHQKRFNKIIEKYDLYYEQGHAWNLALYFN